MRNLVGVKRRHSPHLKKAWAGVAVIADHLNSPHLMGTSPIWQEVKEIVELIIDPMPVGGEKESGKTLLSRRRKIRPIPLWGEAISRFNTLAKDNPIPLMVSGKISPKAKDNLILQSGSIKIRAGHAPNPTLEQMATYHLWEYFFRNNGWERLKQCPQCGKWFVDDSRNKKKERCSVQCTDRWWSWGRRREAGHHQWGKSQKLRKKAFSHKRRRGR
jgi:hypothetical protein